MARREGRAGSTLRLARETDVGQPGDMAIADFDLDLTGQGRIGCVDVQVSRRPGGQDCRFGYWKGDSPILDRQ